MHPILADRRKLIMYLIVWFLLGILIGVLVIVPGGIDWLPMLLILLPLMSVYAFMCLSVWYVCKVFSLQKTPVIQLISIHLIGGIFMSAVWLAIGKLWLDALAATAFPQLDILSNNSTFRIAFGTGLFLYLLSATIHYLLILFETSRQAERRQLEYQIQARQAELRALRAQIDPHFLFNSLNSINALIIHQPSVARAMSIRLADFFRKSLEYGVQETIPLRNEIDLAIEYLAIEQVRFGSRLQVEQTFDPCLGGIPVPPLILQPLVENAVAHGIAHLLQGGIISFHTEVGAGLAKITISNPIDHDRPRKNTKGIGLENVRNRIRTLYGSSARLDAVEREGKFLSEIVLPYSGTNS